MLFGHYTDLNFFHELSNECHLSQASIMKIDLRSLGTRPHVPFASTTPQIESTTGVGRERPDTESVDFDPLEELSNRPGVESGQTPRSKTTLNPQLLKATLSQEVSQNPAVLLQLF